MSGPCFAHYYSHLSLLSKSHVRAHVLSVSFVPISVQAGMRQSNFSRMVLYATMICLNTPQNSLYPRQKFILSPRQLNVLC